MGFIVCNHFFYRDKYVSILTDRSNANLCAGL